ncbi:protein tweety homolog 1-A-like [Lethenteron reissneri]|uniref:protein tweety homolog 1-A-like n=1 Tax=Lethenteron reissneri TaxID=7753 RepID=UPI002AB6DA61|nr:protein tweety homolog 1-A-like [Lethenteron reissneri]
MSSAGYVVPWWVSWLHGFPHLSFKFAIVSSDFAPDSHDYQQALLLLLCLAGGCLLLTLLFLAVHFMVLCCRGASHLKSDPSRKATCCVTTCAIICCAAIAVGFYGNGEAHFGVSQLSGSLARVNQTISKVTLLVQGTEGQLDGSVTDDLAALEGAIPYANLSGLVVQAREQLKVALAQLVGISFWTDPTAGSKEIRKFHDLVVSAEFYRWLAYLLLLIVQLLLCLLVLLGLAKRSRCLLVGLVLTGLVMLIVAWGSLGLQMSSAVAASDFCMSPQEYIVNKTEESRRAPKDVVEYYVYCPPSSAGPLQEKVTASVRAISDMQSIVQKMLQISRFIMPSIKDQLLALQHDLNSTDLTLQKLSALVDCHNIHQDLLEALQGVCYDGVRGVLWLCVFSIVSACSLTVLIAIIPHTSQPSRSRRKRYSQVDDEDPFSPTSSRVGGPARARSPPFTNPFPFGSQSSLQGVGGSGTTALVRPTSPALHHGNRPSSFSPPAPRMEDAPLLSRYSPPPSYAAATRHFDPFENPRENSARVYVS